MAMTLKDFNQLKKLMGLTTSDNDAEALGALRKANQILAVNGYTWESAFRRLVRVESPIEAADDALPERTRASEAAECERFLSDAEAADPRGSRADFVASLDRKSVV